MRTELMLTTTRSYWLKIKAHQRVCADSLKASATAEEVTAVKLMPDLLIPIPFIHSVLSTFLLLTRKGRRANTQNCITWFSSKATEEIEYSGRGSSVMQ